MGRSLLQRVFSLEMITDMKGLLMENWCSEFLDFGRCKKGSCRVAVFLFICQCHITFLITFGVTRLIGLVLNASDLSR